VPRSFSSSLLESVIFVPPWPLATFLSFFFLPLFCTQGSKSLAEVVFSSPPSHEMLFQDRRPLPVTAILSPFSLHVGRGPSSLPRPVNCCPHPTLSIPFFPQLVFLGGDRTLIFSEVRSSLVEAFFFFSSPQFLSFRLAGDLFGPSSWRSAISISFLGADSLEGGTLKKRRWPFSQKMLLFYGKTHPEESFSFFLLCSFPPLDLEALSE